jgi:hypothetical protein
MTRELASTDLAPPTSLSNAISPVARSARWAFRVVITLHAAAAFTQAILAGRFLSGDYDMLEVHYINSQVVGALAIAQVVTGVLYWRPGGGPGWPALASGALLALEPFQIAAGIKRVIGVHVPLAVFIIAASVLFAVWAWTPKFGRRRPAPGARANR